MLTPFGVTLVVVFTAMVFLLMILFALNNGDTCFRGIEDELDEFY